MYRFEIAHRVATELMSGPRRAPGQPQVTHVGSERRQVEVTTASAKRDGAGAFLAMIRAAGETA